MSTKPSIPFSQRQIDLVLALMAIIGGIVGWQLWWNPANRNPSTNGMPSSSAIEEKYGVRFTLVGVTADGGMVDVRYRVLDPDKAMALMGGMGGAGDEGASPQLLVEGVNVRIENSELMSMKQLPEPGSEQFILYANPKGVVVPGTRITIIVGDLRLEHVVAQ